MAIAALDSPSAAYAAVNDHGERDVKDDIRNPSEATPPSETWGPEGFGFGDLIDVINPLQHIPFVSTLYRAVTGDTISPAARTLGGSLYGGPAGLVASVANLFVEGETGQDIGASVVAAIAPGEDTGRNAAETDPAGRVQLASADAAPAAKLAGEGLPPEADPAALFGVRRRVAAYDAAATLVATPTQPAAAGPTAVPGPQQVSGRGLDRLIAESQAKNATRRPGPPPVTLAPEKFSSLNRFETPRRPEIEADVGEKPRSPVANWMMNALDKYESMKRAS